MTDELPELKVEARDTVGISLMRSSESDATVEYVRENQPDASVSARDVFYKIERDGKLTFDMDEISDYLGRDLDTDTFLVNMSSYYGRIVVSDGLIEIFADIKPERFRD